MINNGLNTIYYSLWNSRYSPMPGWHWTAEPARTIRCGRSF